MREAKFYASNQQLRRRVSPQSRQAKPRRRLAAEVLEDRCMLNADFAFLKDINATSRNEGSSPTDVVSVGTQLFFTAQTQTTGRELWVSDGTSDGTHLVRDFSVGSRSSSFSSLTPYNDRLYLIASSQLVATDGTDAGTFVFDEFDATISNGEVDNIVVFQGALYFSAKKYSSNGTLPFSRSLWKSDGTPEGTVSLPSGGNPTGLTVVGDRLYYNSGQQLWMTDGTPDGTARINPAGLSRPSNLTAVELTDGSGGTTERLFFCRGRRRP